MLRKSKAYEVLGLLAARKGVPPMMIDDGAKEVKLREFAQKYKGASCY